MGCQASENGVDFAGRIISGLEMGTGNWANRAYDLFVGTSNLDQVSACDVKFHESL